MHYCTLCVIAMLFFQLPPDVLAAETDAGLTMTTMNTTVGLATKSDLESLGQQMRALSKQFDELSERTASTAMRFNELSERTASTAMQINELSERTEMRLNELSERMTMQLDELKNSLRPVSTVGGYQLTDSTAFFFLVCITLPVILLLLPAASRQHIIVALPTAISNGITAIWAVLTVDKVRELAVFALLLYLLPNFPVVHQLLVKAAKV
ncbi:hypothetical protein QOT17_023408 [Balamuthia mandrillaris]